MGSNICVADTKYRHEIFSGAIGARRHINKRFLVSM